MDTRRFGSWPPPGAGPREPKHDVVEAAVGTLEREGLSALTFTALADEMRRKGRRGAAGRSRTAIVHHFGTRDGLLFAIAEHGFSELGERLRSISSAERPSKETIAAMAMAYATFALEARNRHRAIHVVLGRAGPDDESDARTQAWRERAVFAHDAAFWEVAEAVRDAFGDSRTDAIEKARALTAMVDGFLFQTLDEGIGSELEKEELLVTLDGLLDRLFTGIAT